MILNTGTRTDTVQYYSKWLLKRFEEGYVLSRNPLYPDSVTRYELTPEKTRLRYFLLQKLCIDTAVHQKYNRPL